MGVYITKHLKNQCEKRGLHWDQNMFDFADVYFKKADLTQYQVDFMVECYTEIMVQTFDPKAYSLKDRILLALHFLFGKRLGNNGK